MDFHNFHPAKRLETEIIEQLRQDVEINTVANTFGCKAHHVLKAARKFSLIDDSFTKHDFNFLSIYNGILTRSIVADSLGLPKQTVWKIQKRYNLIEKGASQITSMKQATTIFKYLIEEDYQIGPKYHLPDVLTKKILSGPYYELYKFVLSYVKEFDLNSVLGVLSENTYPDRYRSFQFRDKNNSKNFKSLEELNEALLWCFEKMTGSDLVSLADKDAKIALMNLNEPIIGFNADDLRKKYVSRREWNKFYPDFISLKRGLAEYVGIRSSFRHRRASTSDLRKRYNFPARCEFCDYENNLEIHHIYPVEDTRGIISDEEINLELNLIVLCPNHHRMASKFDWRSSLNSGPANRKKHLKEFLKL